MVLTELIQKQLFQVSIMICAGAAVGILYDARIKNFPLKGLAGLVSEVLYWTFSSFLTFKFLYYCAYGQLSFHSFCAFCTGVLLWRKGFHDTIKDYKREVKNAEKKTQKKQRV